MPDRPTRWISLSSSELRIEIDPLGAQLSTLRDRDGHDLLWGGDPAVWAGRAPLLFPIVGALAGGRYRLGSTSYALSRHGFARGRPFEVADVTSAGATFTLRADAASLQIYPFQFELAVDYALLGRTLAVTARVHNAGNEDLPASFGYHPAFRWPLPYGRARSAHFIEFTQEEPAPMRRLNTAGLLTPTLHPTPIVQRRLALADALFRDDVIIFDKVQSRSVTYGAADGPRLQVSYPDAPYLGIWTKPQADFICIEPWHGIADPEGYTGDFRVKPGVFMVPPGATLPAQMTVTLLDT